MKKIVFVFLFILLFSSLLIISNHNIYLFEEGGFSYFSNSYYSWLSVIYSNTLSFTGNAIKMDWFPENVTKGVSTDN